MGLEVLGVFVAFCLPYLCHFATKKGGNYYYQDERSGVAGISSSCMYSVVSYTANNVRQSAGVTQWTEKLFTDGCPHAEFSFLQE